MLMAAFGQRTSWSKVRDFGSAAAGLLLLALAASVVGGGAGNPVSVGVATLASPFLRMGAAVHRGMDAAWTAAFRSDALAAENELLREELTRARLESATDLGRAALAAAAQEVSANVPAGALDLIAAPVLAAPAPGGRQVLWVGAGFDKGVVAGMVVLGPEGIVGTVESVAPKSAQVRLITDEKSVWGAELEGRGSRGLLRGTGHPGVVEFAFEETALAAEENDTVVSSGMAGSVAPGGVPFGRVAMMGTSKRGEPVALVKLSRDPARLRTVFVLPRQRIPFSSEGR